MQIGRLSGVVFYALRYGEFKEAGRAISRMRALLRDLTEPTYAAHVLLRLETWYLLMRGEWAESARRARALQASARERGADDQLAWAKHWLACARLESRRRGDDA